MQVMKWSLIALAVAGSTQLAVASEQSDSKGFVEDSSLSVLARNLYFSRDVRASGHTGQNYSKEWGQGFIGTFESGFTQGTVGFGVDAIGLAGIKLDGGRGHNETGLFPTDGDGRSEDAYGESGGAVKLRVSNTVLKYGTQFTAMPVLATDDSRLLPETIEGFLVTSKEIEGLELNAGHFTSLNAQSQTYHDSIGWNADDHEKGPGLTEANVLGGTYAISDSLSTSLYYSKVEDYFRKYYANVNYTLPLAEEQSLAFDFNIYDTKGDGRTGSDYSEDALDNRAFSLSGAYTIGAHTFQLQYQQIDGDGAYAYGVDGGGTIFLANSIARSDFNAEDERSYGAMYKLDLATFGVPGLTFMTRYVKGVDANTGETNSGKEWERDVDVKYVLQEGPAKDLSLRVRQATYRSADAVYSESLDELRLIVEYPLSIL
ncbi:OprD family porin [Pseudomonas sp. GV071]|jgi:imipenem/basic amino acid-specific outer membrane pore|uniref:OprD family porin n=1 Tax=Pseudomonas sp. GV071 TaxID=2135754 RepID=UPI000D34C0F9|nr:OprD family porin [Pseudomonas sp. GV071]PTQ72273.1 imipenem/basic amino acid-specific outer membrane pore [Pseudomonas sp. GV071]